MVEVLVPISYDELVNKFYQTQFCYGHKRCHVSAFIGNYSYAYQTNNVESSLSSIFKPVYKSTLPELILPGIPAHNWNNSQKLT